MVVKDFVEKKKKKKETVTIGLNNTVRAVDHVKIESKHSKKSKFPPLTEIIIFKLFVIS